MDVHTSSLVLEPADLGQELAFDRIHEAHRPRIHRYLTRLVGPLDAEDVTQLVFVRASQALPDFRGESSIGTWLYRIARNAAADWLRSRSRSWVAQDALVAEAADAPTGVLGPDEASPPADEALIRRETQQCLHGVIAELPEAYRNVLALSELDGLPNAEIAEALGVSLATVKIRLHRARGRLRDMLTARCAFTRDGRDGLGCEPKGAP